MARTLGIREKSLFFYFISSNKSEKKSRMPREGPRFPVDFFENQNQKKIKDA